MQLQPYSTNVYNNIKYDISIFCNCIVDFYVEKLM
jgi:hypothetical protein